MRRFLVPLVVVTAVAAGGLALAPAARAADPFDWPAPAPVSPTPSASSDGDFATDAYGDPWDFTNDGDVSTTTDVGVQFPSAQVQRVDTNQDGAGGGWLRVPVKGGSEIRLVFDWPGVLPWGRDGRHVSVDANRYSRLSFSVCNRGSAEAAVGTRWEKGDGSKGQTAVNIPPGCSIQKIDLVNPPNVQLPAPWNGTVTRLTFVTSPAQPVNVWEFDWVRLHRPGTPDTPGAVPNVRVLTPNETGQGDYATDALGHAWLAQPGDVALSGATGGVSGGVLDAVNTGNDPSAEFAVPVPFDGGDYHRATVDICYDGGFSLANAAGGGMVGRFHWITDAAGDWSESQDIVVFPGCQVITIDLRTEPTTAVHDENTALKVGFCGRRVLRFAFDPHEDPGRRGFHIRKVTLGGDPHFTSSYGVTFQDPTGRATSASVYVSGDPNAYDAGIRVGAVGVGGTGVQTFNWNGRDAAGAPVPAGQYWVFVVMAGGGGTSAGRSSAPVRYDPPGGQGLGEFVGIQPLRVLDTRFGPLPDNGCHAPAFGGEQFTVQMAGRGEIPAGQVTAVALNVTIVDPTAGTYLTVWPSGEGRPRASNVNAVPGQIIPNMVITKVGADGKVNLFNFNGSSQVVVDVLGYFVPSGGDRLAPIAPVRTLDTRPGTTVGGRTTPLGPGQQLDVTTVAACGAGSSGAALNVTAVSPTGNTFLTVWPAGAGRPTSSNLNATAGQIIPNMAMVRTTNGLASIYNNNGSVDLVVDVIGCFGRSGSSLNPIVPVRALDTRPDTTVGGRITPFAQGETAEVSVTGLTGVPANGVTAVALNVTGVSPTSATFLTVWPAGVARPLASNLNLVPGSVQANMVIAKVTNGKIAIYNHAGSTHVVVDVVGYFTG